MTAKRLIALLTLADFVVSLLFFFLNHASFVEALLFSALNAGLAYVALNVVYAIVILVRRVVTRGARS